MPSKVPAYHPSGAFAVLRRRYVGSLHGGIVNAGWVRIGAGGMLGSPTCASRGR